MPLPTSSLAKICNFVREHIDTLGQETSPVGWDVTVTIGAPGVNLAAASSQNQNTINLFFYRFEPFGFAADALPGDVQWMKVICLITAFGIDEDTDSNGSVDFSAGFNELRMLAQVMRLFQEQPIMLVEGDDAGERWHTQFIPRPLADEQINQIWSSQGEIVYRPSIVYEIALAPIEPEIPVTQAARVASIGTHASPDISDRHLTWPENRDTMFPVPSSVTVNISNPQWAPAIVMVSGAAGDRSASLSLNFEVPDGVDDSADFSSFPEIDIWLAGDASKSNDLHLVGQLLQNPDKDKNSGEWIEITAVDNLSADVNNLDMGSLPEPSPDPTAAAFVLQQTHWTNIDDTQNSWQLQLFAERYIKFDAENNLWIDTTVDDADVRIRSNPVLITLTREIS